MFGMVVCRERGNGRVPLVNVVVDTQVNGDSARQIVLRMHALSEGPMADKVMATMQGKVFDAGAKPADVAAKLEAVLNAAKDGWFPEQEGMLADTTLHVQPFEVKAVA